MSDLRTRIAAVLFERFATAMGFADTAWENTEHETWLEDADAVIAELDMTARCASGCRLQRIAKRLDEMNSQLDAGDD